MTKKELEQKIKKLEINHDDRLRAISDKLISLEERTLGVPEHQEYFYCTGNVTVPKKTGRIEMLEEYLGIKYVEKETKENFYKKLGKKQQVKQ